MSKMATRIPPKFPATTAPPPAKPAASTAPGNPVTNMADWVRADSDFKESQPLTVSDGGKGVSN